MYSSKLSSSSFLRFLTLRGICLSTFSMSDGEPWVLSKDFQALRRATRWEGLSVDEDLAVEGVVGVEERKGKIR